MSILIQRLSYDGMNKNSYLFIRYLQRDVQHLLKSENGKTVKIDNG